METRQSPAEETRAIGAVISQFFHAVSFESGESPRYERLHELFIPRGLLINTTGATPEVCHVDQFIAIRQATFRAGKVTRYRVDELSDTTERFGHIAHRASAFVRNGLRDGVAFSTRGMMFMQFVRTPGGWMISAAAWDDQQPGQMLSGHAEPTEFG